MPDPENHMSAALAMSEPTRFRVAPPRRRPIAPTSAFAPPDGADEGAIPPPQLLWRASPGASAIMLAELRLRHRQWVPTPLDPEHPLMGPQPTD